MESLNRLFDVFGRERRRYALYALKEADGAVKLEELAEEVRRLERDVEEGDPGSFDDVVLSLEHTHLPKAAAAEYIEYDQAADEIRISGEPAEFQIVLAVSEALENPDRDPLFGHASSTPAVFLERVTQGRRTSD